MGSLLARLIGGLAVVLALGGVANAAMVTVSGEVTYRERIALPEGGSLRISLIDLAAPGTPRVSAEAKLATPGQVPLNFDLGFDDGLLLADHSYGLVAEIVAGGAIWFRNNQPVAIDAAALATEIEIVVNFAGKIIDPRAKPVVTINPDLLETTWTAETIGGTPTLPGVESSLAIASDMRAGGRGGCNSYFAQALIEGDKLAFSAVAATRMACLGGASEQETKFFEALAATRFFRLAEDRLYLVDANGKDLATFGK